MSNNKISVIEKSEFQFEIHYDKAFPLYINSNCVRKDVIHVAQADNTSVYGSYNHIYIGLEEIDSFITILKTIEKNLKGK